MSFKHKIKLFKAQQAESYISTINHEMRTPIETVKLILMDALSEFT